MPRARTFAADWKNDLLLPALTRHVSLDATGRAAVIEAMRHDKKRTGAGLALVMCADGFRMLQVADLSEHRSVAALDELAEW